MLSYLLVIIFALFVVHVCFNYNRRARIINKIPGPKGRFIVGNAVEINLPPVELFKKGREYTNKWKGIFRIWSYPFGFVNIYNPEDIEIIISTKKHSDKSVIYKFLKPWLRDGLLLSKGEKWQHRRKILTPTFHFNILREFCVVLEENSSRLVSNLSKVLGEPVNISPLISDHTLSSICETAMGTHFDAESYEYGKSYKETIYNLGSLMAVDRLVKTHLYIDAVYNLTGNGRMQKKYISKIRNFTEKVIRDRKKYLSGLKTDCVEQDDTNIYMRRDKKKRTAMLDLLISAEKEGLIDEEGIQEEVDTFMFEGHDTTAAGLIFLLMLLANNKVIQDNVVKELKEILGGDLEKKVAMEDLSKMRYLECCIKESLRLYPPVHLISRNLDEDIVLSNYVVPAGTILFIHIYDLHRREDLFKNAQTFDPDRFLPENCAGRHPYAYIPFSAGPRNCIGQKFAMLELKSTVSAILRNYELHPVTRPEDIEISSDLVLRNNGPVQVKFVKRL